jgi:hypothetical protein
MKSPNRQAPREPSITKSPKGAGDGYTLGPRAAMPVPVGAVWMTAKQVRARYGNKSHMWLERNIKNNPEFPKRYYQGRLQMFLVAEFDEYDRKLIAKGIGGES